MAHGEQCFGTWRKSKLGTVDDGNIQINSHNGSAISGWHFKSSSPIKGTCDGSEQSFSRRDPDTGKKVSYEGGKIKKEGEKYKIKGKFKISVDANEKSVKGRKKSTGDEWTAEKGT